MNIGWAVQAMRNGETVRRALWREKGGRDGGDFVSVRLEHADGRMAQFTVLQHDGRHAHFAMTEHHLLAEDWELA
jgi:hypothetical protein